MWLNGFQDNLPGFPQVTVVACRLSDAAFRLSDTAYLEIGLYSYMLPYSAVLHGLTPLLPKLNFPGTNTYW